MELDEKPKENKETLYTEVWRKNRDPREAALWLLLFGSGVNKPMVGEEDGLQ